MISSCEVTSDILQGGEQEQLTRIFPQYCIHHREGTDMEKNRLANLRRILYTAERTVIQMGEPDQGIQFALLNPEIWKVQMCELCGILPQGLRE
jgi:hypothetical protein